MRTLKSGEAYASRAAAGVGDASSLCLRSRGRGAACRGRAPTSRGGAVGPGAGTAGGARRCRRGGRATGESRVRSRGGRRQPHEDPRRRARRTSGAPQRSSQQPDREAGRGPDRRAVVEVGGQSAPAFTGIGRRASGRRTVAQELLQILRARNRINPRRRGGVALLAARELRCPVKSPPGVPPQLSRHALCSSSVRLQRPVRSSQRSGRASRSSMLARLRPFARRSFRFTCLGNNPSSRTDAMLHRSDLAKPSEVRRVRVFCGAARCSASKRLRPECVDRPTSRAIQLKQANCHDRSLERDRRQR